jgi:uncharacterized protein (TIGR02145 family)
MYDQDVYDSGIASVDITSNDQGVYDEGYAAGAASVICPDGSSSCPGDLDNDGAVATSDLLIFLAAFGDTCDSGDVIVGCTYPAAVEYNSSANVDDGSCTFLADCAGVINGTSVVDECGVCEGDNSTCLDECGVPNGDNSSCSDECGVPNGDNSSCLDCCGVVNGDGSTCDGDCGACNDNLTCLDECGVLNGDSSSCLDECGVPNGGNLTCLDECGVPNGDSSSCVFELCGDEIGHGNYAYSTVLIGDQCWFSENCRYLPEVSPSSAGSQTSPYYYVNGYEGTDVAAAKATANYDTYGVLYNWPAVMTEGICPSGWHIPTDGEFYNLTSFLGGEYVAGGKMKDNILWNGSNSSGFTGLPGGSRVSSGFFDLPNYSCYLWSVTESDYNSVWRRLLLHFYDDVDRYYSGKDYGLSARCVRN